MTRTRAASKYITAFFQAVNSLKDAVQSGLSTWSYEVTAPQACNRIQVDAFRASFQALLENILVPE